MVDTRSILDGFLGGQGRSSGARPGGIGSLGGGGGGGSLRDVLGGLLGGGGIGSLGGGSSGGGIFGGPIGSRGDDAGRRGGGGNFGGPIGNMGGGLGGMLGGGGGLGGIGTAAAGGLLGSLLGGRRRHGGGGLLRMGGMAVLGTLAYRAWQQWQDSQRQGSAPSSMPGTGAGSVPGAGAAPGPWSGGAPAPGVAGGSAPAAVPPPDEFAREDAPAADGQPFGLSLVKAMISAAKADGHMDEAERGRIFDEVERLELDPEAKGFVFQALDAPADPSVVAAMARTDAQKSEIYMVSRLVAEPDTAAERAYLDALAHRLGLAAGLRQSLDAQAVEAQQLVAAEASAGQPPNQQPG